jgi:hypothetical protein
MGRGSAYSDQARPQTVQHNAPLPRRGTDRGLPARAWWVQRRGFDTGVSLVVRAFGMSAVVLDLAFHLRVSDVSGIRRCQPRTASQQDRCAVGPTTRVELGRSRSLLTRGIQNVPAKGPSLQRFGTVRVVGPVPEHCANSHQNGGSDFLIFVANPRTARLSTLPPRWPLSPTPRTPRPNCGRNVATLPSGPCVSGDRPIRRFPHNRGMPLQIHIQPDPDHLCETCGGPSELISHSINRWHGNEMTREVSPPAPRCVDPWCQSRRPRHLRRETRVSVGHHHQMIQI